MEGKEVAWPATYAPIRVFILEVKIRVGSVCGSRICVGDIRVSKTKGCNTYLRFV